MPLRLAAPLATAVANLIATAVDAGAAGGTIKVYTGAQPANPEATATGTLLATFTLTDPAFAAAVSGAADLDADPDLSVTAAATGTAGWFRLADSDGLPVIDGEVGTAGKQLNLSTTSIVSGGTVTITAGTLTQPAA